MQSAQQPWQQQAPHHHYSSSFHERDTRSSCTAALLAYAAAAAPASPAEVCAHWLVLESVAFELGMSKIACSGHAYTAGVLHGTWLLGECMTHSVAQLWRPGTRLACCGAGCVPTAAQPAQHQAMCEHVSMCMTKVVLNNRGSIRNTS